MTPWQTSEDGPPRDRIRVRTTDDGDTKYVTLPVLHPRTAALFYAPLVIRAERTGTLTARLWPDDESDGA